jgi:hypothetical protein
MEKCIMSFQTRLHRLDADQKLIDGVTKHLSQIDSLTVGSQKVAPADIVKILQTRIDAAHAVVAADAAQSAAVKKERDERAKTKKFVSSFRRMVSGMFSESPDTLAEFGLKTPRVGKLSADEKAAAVARNKATREARHTLGKKQKLEITGSSSNATNGASSHKPELPPKQPNA